MKNQELIAEFIGIMLGDGSIGIYDCKCGNKIKKNHIVKVTLDSRNKQYTSYVFNIMKDVFGIEPKLHYKNTDNYKRKENAVDIRLSRKDCVGYALNDMGLRISPKWNNMIIPEKYNSGRFSLLVLKGLLDTDGHLSVFNNNGVKYPRIEIRLCPSPAQKQINNILDEFGFKYKIQNLERGKTRIRISGKEELQKWFDLIGSANHIHVEKAKELIKIK